MPQGYSELENMTMHNGHGSKAASENMANETEYPDELTALATRIDSALKALAQTDAELDKADRQCTRTAFSLEKQTARIHAIIAESRAAMTKHRAVLMKVGEVCAEALRHCRRLNDSGIPARAVLRKKELTSVFLLNILMDEYFLGHLSHRSAQARRILDLHESLMDDTRQVQSRTVKRENRHIIRRGDLPEFGPSADWLLAIVAKPSSCRKLGHNAHALTRSILRIAALLVVNFELHSVRSMFRVMVLFWLLWLLSFIRARLYGQPNSTLKTKDRLYLAKQEDKNLSSLLGTRITVKSEYTLSRHEMQKCRSDVSLLFEDIQSLAGLSKLLSDQNVLFFNMLDERNAMAAEIRKDMDLYDSLWAQQSPEEYEKVPSLAPATSPMQSVPTKYRKRGKYHSRNKTEPAPSVHVRTPEFLATQESKQWKADLAELTDEQRTLFTTVAQTIPRSQARKPLGRSDGRLLFTLPVGDSHRLVYSIDAGIAVLERAFGLASHAEDYRKYRKDIQKGKT
jgi:hypothetical protein